MTFFRSYDTARDAIFTEMSSPATISTFRLDKYEVTVGRFRVFVTAQLGTKAHPPKGGDGAHTRISGSGWDPSWSQFLELDSTAFAAALRCDAKLQTWTDLPGPNESRPVNCLTWFEAMAFCAWDGGFLPTEAEWNAAAAGGDEQRAFPWSVPPDSVDTLDSAHASYSDDAGCIGDGIPECSVTDLVVVGSKPAGDGRWGHSELAGNVAEWVLDVSSQPYVSPCSDCANLTGISPRIVRGGALDSIEIGLRVASRRARMPTERDGGIGVRCARAP